MGKFEEAVIKELDTLPEECWQRVDGLMCSPAVMKTYPQWFPKLRLWFMEKRGIIQSRKTNHSFWRSQNGMKTYQLITRNFAE